ncbi:MAG: MerR family transcriptional regulator [Fimbriimonadaceae bacterium]
MGSYYSIRAAAEETGLSAHTIRAWERRYGVVAPVRTGTNRRVFGAEDIRRLKMLRRAVESGHSIGMIAALPNEELGRLTSDGNRQDQPASGDANPGFVSQAIRALHTLDANALEAALVRASYVLGVDGLVDEVVVPLMREIGRKWASGEFSIAQEHIASAIIRAHLERTRLQIQPSRNAPRLIAATPAGQHHEIGAILVATVAARMDWDVTYLGPNLPAEDIAEFASRTNASVVTLSIVHPHGDPAADAELRRMGTILSKDCQLLVGGEAAESYAGALKEIGATVCPDMESTREWLDRARTLCARPVNS